jgi:pyruvate dehydrogenase E2 component (dihydrolipoamide acetyltransferase)
MELGSIVSWEKKEGEFVEEGDVLAQVETDKATMEMESPVSGYIAKILVPAGAGD